ncbi:hypothetical protein CFK37_09900 [Virgibacillus phasianinus]|uniref:Uncharacterized protein n=2 Tax=Virgibacillus phasianinus TaxID=2017483 RepID=A0A220U8S1_9BACI|nr:hypothetical protein CFK37_09900 [Virgibacillus phasianinus]
MSHHKEFLLEKEKIDNLYNKGYRITAVNETLSGAFVEFSRVIEKKILEKEELQFLNPDTRIYFSTLIRAEQKAE